MGKMNSLTINGKRYNEFNGAGGGVSVAYFDLAAMGLPAITPDGTRVVATMDTSEIRSAMAGGFVKFGLRLNYVGAEVYSQMVGVPMYMDATDTYQVSRIIVMGEEPMFGSITVGDGYIVVVANMVGHPDAAGNVEATGVILKSSTPGSTKRFLLTVDDDGQPNITEV